MSKTGRNESCPCGSRRKFKRCCGAPGANPTQAPTPVTSPARPYPDPRKLDTERIRAQLRQWGIAADGDALRDATSDRHSAQSLGEYWLQTAKTAATVDEDFVFGAAIELWRREISHRPSTEMLEDWIDEGHDLEGQRRDADACTIWHKAWDVLRDRIPPSARTTGAADRALRWDSFVMNLLGDLQTAYLNAARSDPALAERGIQFSLEILERFPEESDSFMTCFRADLGDLLAISGQSEAAERLFLALISDYPQEARGYCHLAELFRESDPAQALSVLEQAVRAPVRDGADYDLEIRLADLRRAATPGPLNDSHGGVLRE